MTEPLKLYLIFYLSSSHDYWIADDKELCDIFTDKEKALAFMNKRNSAKGLYREKYLMEEWEVQE